MVGVGTRAKIRTVVLGLTIAVLGTTAVRAEAPSYLDHDELVARIRAIAGAHPDLVSVVEIGTSFEGRSIHAIELAAGADDDAGRSAMLIVANLDGDHLVGSATAIGVVEAVLERYAAGDEPARALLDDHALYVVPRVNPDAAEHFFSNGVRDSRRRSMRPDDADRDGSIDEDPPNDIDGDGRIMMMRVPDPREANRRANPDEPRLDLEADPAKAERVDFHLVIEGIDDDGDGELNEDPIGGVDLNRNFMHAYRAHEDGTGRHQVSEPESLALLKYVLDRQNIAVVLTYGRHDNLVESPEDKGRDPAGAPKTIEKADAALYAQIGERFREITGLKRAEEEAADGAFFAWAYAQFGVPSFATALWARPDVPEPADDEDADDEDADEEDAGEREEEAPAQPDGDDDADPALTASSVGDISQETLDELEAAAVAEGVVVTDEMRASITPEQVEQYAQTLGVAVRRVPSKPPARVEGEDAAWLRYSDEVRNGEGFVAWTPFEHPELGPVEIGGWMPYFRTNPPLPDLEPIVEVQTDFALDLADRLPVLRLAPVEIKTLAPGLFEVRTALVNDGYLPTGTAMAVRNRRARPHVVRLGVEPEQVVAGRRITKIWSIAGSGGRSDFRWLIEAPPESTMTITVYSEKYGSFDTDVLLRDTEGGAS